jgi:hypothetical protein
MADPQAVVVLRGLGGFTSVIGRGIDAVMSSAAGNFRMQAHAAEFHLKFTRELPAIRERLQLLLAQVRWTPTVPREPGPKHGAAHQTGIGLGPGIYSELPLRAKTLGWRGVADLVEVTPSEITITEFKTAPYNEQHLQQLRTYAVLWRFDERLNPAGRVADRLVLSYPEKTISVATPDHDSIRTIETLLAERAREARAACGQAPPRAKREENTCPFCPVRHLCEEYWAPDNTISLTSGNYTDCELSVTAVTSPWSWQARLLRTPGKTALVVPKKCVLYTQHHSSIVDPPIAVGARYRVLNCRLEIENDGGAMAVSVALTSGSEVFEC